MKVAIWGTGKTEREIEPYILDSIDIVTFVDNAKENCNFYICIVRRGQYIEIPIISPQNLKQIEYDYVLIAAAEYKKIKDQCVNNLGIPEQKVLQVFDLGLWSAEQTKKFFHVNIMSDRNNYYIEGMHVWMNSDHMLPIEQRTLAMYDRFIPYLGKLTKEKKGNYIIDIGANIGDTLVAMWNHISDRYICIEPTEEFLNLCRKNAKSLNGNDRIFFEQIFITDNVGKRYVSKINKGTAVKEEIEEPNKEPTVQSGSLDGLLAKKEIDPNEIDLIKIDTDGFDADCIISGENVLKQGSALVYWENEIDTYEQYEKYQEAYDLLEEAGYTTYFIFDNCGNYMCKGDISIVRSLADYQQRINMGWDRITFNYLDVLACKDEDVVKCQSIIECYLKQYLLCRKKHVYKPIYNSNRL